MIAVGRKKIKRKWNDAAGPRKDLGYQKNINFKMRTILKLMRKQETLNKKIMRLLREMVEYNNFNLELQTLASSLKLKAALIM